MIEVVLALIASVVVGTVTVLYITQLISTNQLSSAQVQVVDEANLALEFLARELRSVDELSGAVRCGSPAVSCVLSTPYTAFTFTKRFEVPVDPLRRDTNNYNIQYAYNGGSSTLERTSAGITTTVATGVTSFTVTETANGLFRFRLNIVDASGANFLATSSVRLREILPAYNVAYVVDSPGGMSAGESALNTHLVNLGQNVSVFDDDDHTWIPTDFDVIVLSGEGGNADDAWLSTALTPILTTDARNFDEFNLGTGGSRNGGGTDAVVLAFHPVTEIFPIGPPALTLDSGGFQGYITGYANDVQKLMEYSSGASRAKILVVETGNQLASGGATAPARRAYFGAREFSILNDDGIALFNRTLAWVAQ